MQSIRLTHLAWALAIASCVLQATATRAAEPWRTGQEQRRHLAAKVGVQWQQLPLRQGLQNLADQQRMAIFLDRRVDPDQEIELDVVDARLLSVVEQIAAESSAGVGFVGPVIYVGPVFECQRLATLAEWQNRHLAKRHPQRHRELLEPRPSHWDRLATPQDLISATVRDVAMVLENPEVVPHDVWPAYQLPPMTWAERMTLLLAGFGMSFQVDAQGRSVRLVKFPSTVVLHEEYDLGKDAHQRARRIEKDFPQAFVQRIANNRLRVGTTLEDHWRIAELLSGRPPAKENANGQRGPEKRYTLTVKNQPVETLLDVLAKRMDWTVRMPEDVHDIAQQRVSFEVREVTVEELLQAILEPAGLRAVLDGKNLTVARRP